MEPSRRAARWALAAGIPLVLLTSAPLHGQELRYSLTPTAQWVQWNDALGIDDAYLWGGRAGFTFGQLVEVQGFYMTRGRIDTQLGGDVGSVLPGSTESTLGIRNYGADLVLNLATSQLKPFVRAGGSVLRFAPEGLEPTRQIALRYGGGIRFGNPGQLRVQVFAEDLMFRLDRTRIGTMPAGEIDPDANTLRHNLVYGAGVTIPLGGAAMGDDRPVFGLGNFSLPLEVFGGVLNFADDLGFDGQNLAGVRTGINFGPLVGLRGYYWRGMNDGFSSFAGVESWGGEAQFRLNAGPGLSPYVVAGAGQLNFRTGFVPDAELPPDDRTMLILGGGLALELSERLRLNLAGRNHLFNVGGEITDAARTNDLQSNWMWSAGLGFDIGGMTRSGPRAPVLPPRIARVDTVVVDESGVVVREIREDQVRRDTVFVDAQGRRVAEREIRPGEPRTDTVFVDAEGRRVVERGGVVELAPQRAYTSERTVQIPVPTEGELYVRYGPGQEGTPAGVVRPLRADAPMTDEQTREAIREVLRDELRRSGVAPGGAVDTPESRELFERRLLDRIDSAMVARQWSARQQPGAALAPAPTVEERELERQRLLRDIEAIVRDQVQLEWQRREAVRPVAPPPAQQYVPPPQAYVPPPQTPASPPQTYAAPPAGLVNPPRRTLGDVSSFSVYAGVNTPGEAQFVTGVRLDAGPFAADLQRLTLVPEVALGFGNGTTGLLAANGRYRPAPFTLGSLGLLSPYGQVGVGFLAGTLHGDRTTRLMVNPAYGVEFFIPQLRGTTGTSQLFVEHQGLDLFSRNRLLTGLRWIR